MNAHAEIVTKKVVLDMLQSTWPDYQINQQQFEVPTPEFVNELFERVMDSIQLLLSSVAKNDSSPEPNIKANSSVTYLVAFVNLLLEKVNPNFDCVLTLTDIYEPTAKRTMVRFKILLSLLFFCNNQLNKVKNVFDKVLQKAETYKVKKVQKEVTKEELAKIAESVAHLEDAVIGAPILLQKSNLRYQVLQKENDDNDRKNQKSKEELSGLVTIYKNKQALCTNLNAHIQQLNKQVLPETRYNSLLDLMENLSKKNADFENETKKLNDDLERKQPSIEHFQNLQTQAAKLIIDAETLKTLQNEFYSKKSLLEMSKLTFMKKTADVNQLEEDKLRVKKTLKANEQMTESKIHEHSVSLSKIQEKLKQVKLDQINEEKQKNTMTNLKKALEEKISAVTEKYEETTIEIQDLNLIYANQYKNMLDATNTVTNNFSKVITDFSEKSVLRD